jgi:hypothetical protein
MREMSVAEQRCKAVLAVAAEGRTVTQVAGDWGVTRQTMPASLGRYEADAWMIVVRWFIWSPR